MGAPCYQQWTRAITDEGDLNGGIPCVNKTQAVKRLWGGPWLVPYFMIHSFRLFVGPWGKEHDFVGCLFHTLFCFFPLSLKQCHIHTPPVSIRCRYHPACVPHHLLNGKFDVTLCAHQNQQRKATEWNPIVSLQPKKQVRESILTWAGGTWWKRSNGDKMSLNPHNQNHNIWIHKKMKHTMRYSHTKIHNQTTISQHTSCKRKKIQSKNVTWALMIYLFSVGYITGHIWSHLQCLNNGRMIGFLAIQRCSSTCPQLRINVLLQNPTIQHLKSGYMF